MTVSRRVVLLLLALLGIAGGLRRRPQRALRVTRGGADADDEPRPQALRALTVPRGGNDDENDEPYDDVDDEPDDDDDDEARAAKAAQRRTRRGRSRRRLDWRRTTLELYTRWATPCTSATPPATRWRSTREPYTPRRRPIF